MPQLIQCLNSIVEQTLRKSAFEIIVVLPSRAANSVHAQLHDIGLENLVILSHPVASANHSRNEGAQFAKGEWLFFLDDDCVLTDAQALVRRITLHEQLGSKVIFSGDYLSIRKMRVWGRAYNLVVNLWLANAFQRPHRLRFVGGNVSCRRDQFQSIEFNESLNGGGEEEELAMQFVSQGAVGFQASELAVCHLSNHTASSFFRRAVTHGLAKSIIKGAPGLSKNPPTMGDLCSLLQKYFRLCHAEPLATLLALSYLSVCAFSHRLAARTLRQKELV